MRNSIPDIKLFIISYFNDNKQNSKVKLNKLKFCHLKIFIFSQQNILRVYKVMYNTHNNMKCFNVRDNRHEVMSMLNLNFLRSDYYLYGVK